MNEKDINLSVNVDTTEIERATEKAKELNGLLEKARSLLHELADMEINLSVNV